MTRHPITLNQLAAADRELHVRLAELTRSGLHPGPTGGLPLDDHVKTLLAGPEIRWMLMPMPKKASASSTQTVERQQVVQDSDPEESQR